MVDESRPLADGQVPHPYSERWAPYKDAEGNVVTITWDQVWAVFHAVKVVDEVRWHEPSRRGSEPTPKLADDFPTKSRALGRLLIDGKPLFDALPPMAMGACAYELWDQENEEATDAES